MILSSNITFLITGRVQEESLSACLYSIFNYYPDSSIVLSTWLEDYESLSPNIKKLILTRNIKLFTQPDPGSTIRELSSNKPLNYIRQMSSTNIALSSIQTMYTFRLRGDIFFTGNDMLKDNRIEESLSRHKICVTNITSVKPDRFRSKSMLFHLCDWLHFGLTADIIYFFTQAMVSEKELCSLPRNLPRNKDINYADLSKLSPEQLFLLCSPFLKALTTTIEQYNYDPALVNLSLSVIDQHFTIHSPKRLQYKSSKYNLSSHFFRYYMYLDSESLINPFFRMLILSALYMKHILARLYFCITRSYYVH